MFNVVLVEPEIPPNTGNVGRLCLATQSTLHLIKPFGFTLNDRDLRRAGLDYWNEVDIRVWESLEEFERTRTPEARWFLLTTKCGRAYYNVRFKAGDFLVFGRETKGLPKRLLNENPGDCVTIPMQGTRSLNLATAVGIVLFEAVRQQRACDMPGLEWSS